MSKPEHSPLPWSEHLVDEVQIVSRVGDYDEVCTASGDYDHDYERMYANAQFIVTACNSYYDNQQAIAELVEALEMVQDGNAGCQPGYVNTMTLQRVSNLIAKHKAKS